MKLEDQVVSLELAKKLKELGVRQESLFYWNDCWMGKPTLDRAIHSDNGKESYSAFTVAELGEMLPHHNIKMYNIQPRIQLRIGGKELNAFVEAETEADARAKMLIYLIENKLISL